MSSDSPNRFPVWIKAAAIKSGWLPLAFFLFHQLLARVFDAYNSILALDIPMHFFGGVVFGNFAWLSVSIPEASPAIGDLNRAGKVIFATNLVCVAVVFWEFAEWWIRSQDQIRRHCEAGLRKCRRIWS